MPSSVDDLLRRVSTQQSSAPATPRRKRTVDELLREAKPVVSMEQETEFGSEPILSYDPASGEMTGSDTVAQKASEQPGAGFFERLGASFRGTPDDTLSYIKALHPEAQVTDTEQGPIIQEQGKPPKYFFSPSAEAADFADYGGDIVEAVPAVAAGAVNPWLAPVGAAAGSAIRQGVSAVLPGEETITPGERAFNAGFNMLTSVPGSKALAGGKALVGRYGPTGRLARKAAKEAVVDAAGKQVPARIVATQNRPLTEVAELTAGEMSQSPELLAKEAALRGGKKTRAQVLSKDVEGLGQLSDSARKAAGTGTTDSLIRKRADDYAKGFADVHAKGGGERLFKLDRVAARLDELIHDASLSDMKSPETKRALANLQSLRDELFENTGGDLKVSSESLQAMLSDWGEEASVKGANIDTVLRSLKDTRHARALKKAFDEDLDIAALGAGKVGEVGKDLKKVRTGYAKASQEIKRVDQLTKLIESSKPDAKSRISEAATDPAKLANRLDKNWNKVAKLYGDDLKGLEALDKVRKVARLKAKSFVDKGGARGGWFGEALKIVAAGSAGAGVGAALPVVTATDVGGVAAAGATGIALLTKLNSAFARRGLMKTIMDPQARDLFLKLAQPPKNATAEEIMHFATQFLALQGRDAAQD